MASANTPTHHIPSRHQHQNNSFIGTHRHTHMCKCTQANAHTPPGGARHRRTQTDTHARRCTHAHARTHARSHTLRTPTRAHACAHSSKRARYAHARTHAHAHMGLRTRAPAHTCPRAPTYMRSDLRTRSHTPVCSTRGGGAVRLDLYALQDFLLVI